MTATFLKADSFEGLAKQIPSDILTVFACSLQIGCWPDGTLMTSIQRHICEKTLRLRQRRGGLH
ncbi:MAG: hypothetical protein AAGI14_05940 [Pseudomonadota bacterium]